MAVQDLPREDALTSSRNDFVAIYALIDPRDNEIRYVGKAVDPDARLYGHWVYARRDESARVYRDWMTALFSARFGIVMEILDWVHEDLWQEAEREWIAYGKEVGWPLLNVMPGGASAPSGDLHWSRREPERWLATQREIWAKKKAEGYSEIFIESRRAGGRASRGRTYNTAVTWATCECGYQSFATRAQYHANARSHKIESFWCWTDPAKRRAKNKKDV